MISRLLVAQKCPYTNFSLSVVLYPIHQRSVQRDAYCIFPAGEAKDDFHIVIVHIDGHQKRAELHGPCLAFKVAECSRSLSMLSCFYRQKGVEFLL